MQNGTYRVEFITKLGQGAGIAVIQDGKIRGGDSSMMYIGEYALDGSIITAQVKADVHTRLPGVSSVFGIDAVTISLVGEMKGGISDSVHFDGTAKEAPGVSFKAHIKKIAD